MEYRIFRDRLLENMKIRMGDRGSVKLITVQKNNVADAESLLIRLHGREAAPTIRVSSCYESFLKGVSMEEMVENLLQVAEQEIPEFLQGIDLKEYESVRGRISMRLVNTCQNAGMLLDHPHRAFKDLSVTYRVDLFEQGDENYSTAVTTAMLHTWGKTEDDLFRQAWENMNRCNDSLLIPIEQMLFSVLNGGIKTMDKENGLPDEDEEMTGLYALTNRDGSFGAIQLLNDQVLKEASDKLGGDYWIFPSSVHELILAPDTMGRTRQELEEMVRDINRCQVDPEEVLSDSVYFYEHTTGILC